MNCNFDKFSTINDYNGDDADLTPYWEVAEANYLKFYEYQWWEAICAPDYVWEFYAETMHATVRECEEILAEYGIIPNVRKAYEKYGYVC